MKKILGIVVLSLLLSGNAYAMTESKAMELLSNKSLDKIEGIWGREGSKGIKRYAIVKLEDSIEVIALQTSKLFKIGDTAAIISKNSSNNYSGQMFGNLKGESLISNIVYTMSGTNRFIESNNSKYGTITLRWNREWPIDFDSHNAKFKIQDEKEEEKRLALMINEVKKTCSILGFESGTEKFADCTLKLYSQKVDELIAEKQTKFQQTNTTTQSSSGTNTTIIYDPVRDRQNNINKGMKMLSGKCTLGVDC